MTQPRSVAGRLFGFLIIVAGVFVCLAGACFVFVGVAGVAPGFILVGIGLIVIGALAVRGRRMPPEDRDSS